MHALTGRITCQMLGVALPPEREAATYADILAIGERLAAAIRFSTPPLTARQVIDLREAFERLVAPARAAYADATPPAGSIVARLRELDLSFDEVKGVLGTLFMVGTQTTSVALPRALALLLDTGQWARLRERPDLLPHALDEALRCTVPVPITVRTAARDVEVDNHRFRAGSRLVIFTYNLAKSPSVVGAPGRCDIQQPLDPRARNLWYGSGPHFCLGYGLAQYELRAVLQTLLDLPGRLRITRRRYARHVLLPAYARLDVRLVTT
jgi:cytochrome P450